MSILCQTFVENAWRSDLCSNCFKSLDDHKQGSHSNTNAGKINQRYISQAAPLYQSLSTSVKWRISESQYERVAKRDFASQTPPKTEGNKTGILVKSPEKKARSRSSVDFASEEALVIGYGGNDYDSDLSPWEMGSDDGSIDFDLLDDTDEDRNITKLTKNNTEFNSSNQNLLVSDNGSKTQKKEIDHSTTPKNNSSSINRTEKSLDKSLSITYNNIQTTEKEVSHYRYPSRTENIKSYLNNNDSECKVEVNGIKNNNVNLLESYNTDNLKKQNLGISEESCKNLLNDNFTPLNTRTYSFVSDLNKNNRTSFEHSSDSDYSTCRLTAGDSTDSESFHDADEARIEPCPSFLHGSYPQTLTAIRDLDCDKKYDGNSSTSGDISNLSDDSDSNESTKKAVYKTKSPKNTKTVSEIQNNRSSKTVVTVSNVQSPAPNVTDSKSIKIHLKESPAKSQDQVSVTLNSNGNEHKTSSLKIMKKSAAKEEQKEVTDAINKAIEAQFNATTQINIQYRNAAPSNKSNSRDSLSIVNNCIVQKEDSNPPIQIKSNKEDTGENKGKVQKSIPQSIPTRDSFCGISEVSPEKHEFDSNDINDGDASPDTIAQRQSKLAALALELELARRDSLRPSNGNAQSMPQMSPPPDVVIPSNPSMDIALARLSETPAKTKKSRFSLKKLLKRNSKDNNTFTPPTGKEAKAWKKQTFDRSRLSLEIVHPMDLVNEPVTSGESTPTDDSHYQVSNHPAKAFFKSGYSRAKSLSSLPQVSAESVAQSNCSLLECRKVETLPSRKAGTVAERKKNRPSLVRTPSCSAIPSRPAPPSDEKVPPPKPPPPPKYKVQQPPPPPPAAPHPVRCPKSNYPARPPPPKIPEAKCRNSWNQHSNSGDKEYANLGDIRSQLMPKKPDRASAPSALRECEDGLRQPQDNEEDHYTYLDVTKASKEKKVEVAGGRRPWLDLETSYSAIAAANYDSLAEIITASLNERTDSLKFPSRSIQFKDFELETVEVRIILCNRIICHATCRNETQDKVMLMIIPRNGPPTRNLVRHPVLASFADHVPKEFGHSEFASVYILRRSHVSTIHKFCEESALDSGDQHIHLRDYCFVLLQLIHTLKSLQAEGIEEVHFDLKRLILVTTHDDKPPTFVLFPEDKTYLCDSSRERKTLCQAILSTLYYFLRIQEEDELNNCAVNGKQLAQPVAHTFSAIARVLMEEKASSLTQAKGLLEYMLWGPVDLLDTSDDLETVLQRWLDLQRAQMVKSTIPQLYQKENCNTHIHIFEEYQLIFLLQASVKSLKTVISKL